VRGTSLQKRLTLDEVSLRFRLLFLGATNRTTYPT
jgi:hypothetical protein